MIHFTDIMRVFLTYCKNLKKMGLHFILFKIFFIVKKKKRFVGHVSRLNSLVTCGLGLFNLPISNIINITNQ